MVKPGYKQTEIGVIPDDWDCVSLLEKCVLLNGLTYTPDNVKEHGLLVIRSSNIQNNQLFQEPVGCAVILFNNSYMIVDKYYDINNTELFVPIATIRLS